MLKFWKKKTAEAEAADKAAKPVATAAPADNVAPEDDLPLLREVLAELPAPADTRPETERFVAPAEAPAAAPTSRSLGSLFVRHPKLDDDLLDQLETILITADVGVEASTELVEALRKRMHKREFADAPALLAALRQALVDLLEPVEQSLRVDGRKPFVTLVVGINGVGKTTTIGKLARRWRDEGHAVMLAAGDTFRAAAVEQLRTWGERNQVPVISQGQDADAASVIFDALQAARSRGIDVLIAGTAGQNAISQVRQFRQIVGVTGLVVTKLDGTAKGGVVFALAREFGLPIRFVGLGETATDLRVFEAGAFVDGLLPESVGHG